MTKGTYIYTPWGEMTEILLFFTWQQFDLDHAETGSLTAGIPGDLP